MHYISELVRSHSFNNKKYDFAFYSTLKTYTALHMVDWFRTSIPVINNVLYGYIKVWSFLCSMSLLCCNINMCYFLFRYLSKPWKQVLEAVLVACTTTTTAFILTYTVQDCQALGKDPTLHPLQVS